MSVQQYETMFLLDPTKVSADADGVKNLVHHLIERHGGQIMISRPWDYNHKLSYPIAKQKKGAFHVVYYTMESTHQAALERDFQLAEGVILRQLTSKLDPKWADQILQVAREDHSNGFALRGMQEEAQTVTDPAAIGGDPAAGGGPDMAGVGGPPRRGPRREFADKPE